MAASTAQVVQQSGVVKGQVLDPSGEPVIGATVRLKGSKTGTVTDFDGNFSLSAVPGLQISSSSGSMDATPNVNVRGTTTIGEGSKEGWKTLVTNIYHLN